MDNRRNKYLSSKFLAQDLRKKLIRDLFTEPKFSKSKGSYVLPICVCAYVRKYVCVCVCVCVCDSRRRQST